MTDRFLLTGSSREILASSMQKFRLSNLSWSDRYQNLIRAGLIIILVLAVFFPVTFLGYEPFHRDTYVFSEEESLNNNELWNNSIYSGTPWFWDHAIFENNLSSFLGKISGALLDWRIAYLILAGLGVYLLLVFLKMDYSVAFLAALFYCFSPLLFDTLGDGSGNAFKCLTLVPFLILFLHYLSVRRSILALGFLSLFFYLYLRISNWEGKLLLAVLIIFFLVREIIFALSRRKYLNLLVSVSLLLAALVLGLIPAFFHHLALFNFTKAAEASFLQPDPLFFIYSFLVIALVAAMAIYLDKLLSRTNLVNPSTVMPKVLMIISLLVSIVLFALLLSGAVDAGLYPLVLFPGLTFLFGFSFLFLKGIISRQVLVTLLAGLFILSFLAFNRGFYPALVKPGDLTQKPVQNLTDDFLDQDTEIYRIYPLGSNFYRNRWAWSNQSIGGSGYPLLKRYSEVIRHCLPAEIKNRVPINWNIVNMLNAKYLIYDEKLSLDNLKYSYYDLRQKITVYENLDYLPRAWFVRSAEIITKPRNIRRKLNDPEFNPRETAILETDPGTFNLPAQSGIRLEEYSNTSLLYQVETDTLAFLVTSEIFYHDGWKAYLNEREIEIFPANYILRGMLIPAGNHELRLEFMPDRKRVFNLAAIIGIVLIAITILIGALIYRNKNYRGEIVYHLKT